MANIIFDTICNNKNKIIEIASNIIDEAIKNESVEQFMDEDIKEYESRISSNKLKLDKIVDMYINELIDKDSYIKKKSDIEKNIQLLNEKIENLSKDRKMPKAELKDKLSILKNNIVSNLEYNNNDEISEDIIEAIVEKIVVKKDRYIWKLNYFKEIYDLEALKNISTSKLNDDSNDFYLTSIIITDDDVKKYKSRLKSCGLERTKKLKNNIFVDLYI